MFCYGYYSDSRAANKRRKANNNSNISNKSKTACTYLSLQASWLLNILLNHNFTHFEKLCDINPWKDIVDEM